MRTIVAVMLARMAVSAALARAGDQPAGRKCVSAEETRSNDLVTG
jgi:hypothetical protein